MIELDTRSDIIHFLNTRRLIGEGAEIGVQFGRFSAEILRGWRGAKLYSIDPWKEFGDEYVDVANVSQLEHDKRYREASQRLLVFGLRSEIIREESSKAASRFRDEQLDFVYIDAAHDYQAVKADINLWWPKVRPGGIISGHDYLDGRNECGLFGVKSAVDQFVESIGCQLVTTKEPFWKSWLAIK